MSVPAAGRRPLELLLVASLFPVAAQALLFAGDLSAHRTFRLGADLPAVAARAGARASGARAARSRPSRPGSRAARRAASHSGGCRTRAGQARPEARV